MSGGLDDFEQPMTADAMKVRQDLCAFYAIPESCLLSRVPPILQVVDDHVLFPLSPGWSATRWIRVSSLELLKKVCYKFRNILRGKTLRIFVMPYISLLDGHLIHELIDNPGKLHLTGNPGDEQVLPVSGRSGVLYLYDSHGNCGLELDFTVINYGLLWAKASAHANFMGTTDQAKELIREIEDHKDHVMQDLKKAVYILTADHLQNLEAKLEDLKLDYLLSLHREDINPHNAIKAMDSELHEELYGLGYDPCYPNDKTEYPLVQATQAAVDIYMDHLEETGHDICNVKDAEWIVLKGEGGYEAEAHCSNAIKEFHKAMETCIGQLSDAITKMKIFEQFSDWSRGTPEEDVIGGQKLEISDEHHSVSMLFMFINSRKAFPSIKES